MSAPRRTRAQVDAALAAEPCPADREDWETLAVEVRALRAELADVMASERALAHIIGRISS